jgi:hypothetical protein
MARFLLALSLSLPLALQAADPVPERLDLLRQAAAVRPHESGFHWQQIPWLVEPAEALKQAKTENRPLLVWLAGGRDRDGSPLERC